MKPAFRTFLPKSGFLPAFWSLESLSLFEGRFTVWDPKLQEFKTNILTQAYRLNTTFS